MTRRFLLVAVWALSLVFAGHIGARAQNAPAPPPPGVEVRFVLNPAARGTHTGRLMAFLDGQWVPVTLEHQGGVVPAH
jgi:hypothetical protein